MKKISYLILVLILLQFMLLSINTYVLASSTDQTGLISPIQDPDIYKPTPEPSTSFNAILKVAGSVLGSIRNIGIIVSVISVMIVGIKYILGSVEEKAEYKATMIPIVIGIVMLSSIITIIDIIYTATTNIFG